MSLSNLPPGVTDAMIEQQQETLQDRLRKRAAIRRKIPRKEPDRISDILEEAASRIDHLEFEIDNLMLEDCPEEISKKQMENWGRHQKPIDKT